MSQTIDQTAAALIEQLAANFTKCRQTFRQSQTFSAISKLVRKIKEA